MCFLCDNLGPKQNFLNIRCALYWLRYGRLDFGLKGVHMTKDQPAPQKGIRIDRGLIEVSTMASKASREDSCPKSILKFHCSSSLDYRACQEIPVNRCSLTSIIYLVCLIRCLPEGRKASIPSSGIIPLSWS